MSCAEALRRLGMCPTGNSHGILKKYARLWGISMEHWDPYAAVRGQGPRRRRPLAEIMVEHSSFSRHHLKNRLYAEGLKQPVCELCGQSVACSRPTDDDGSVDTRSRIGIPQSASHHRAASHGVG